MNGSAASTGSTTSAALDILANPQRSPKSPYRKVRMAVRRAKKRPHPAMIVNEADAGKALKLIEALGGCLEESAEERALIDLVFKFEVWEAKEQWRRTAPKRA